MHIYIYGNLYVWRHELIYVNICYYTYTYMYAYMYFFVCMNECVYVYTGCFTTLDYNCRIWFPRSL